MMRREDLRVRLVIADEVPDCGHDGCSEVWESWVHPVSDTDLAELGYVKLSDVNPVLAANAERHGIDAQTMLEATEEEWAESRGYVKVPDCEDCEGHGIDPESYVPATHLQPSEADPCPSCGGSGKQRLVALSPVIFDAIRRHYEVVSSEHPDGWQRAPQTETMVTFREIFAALEGETDE